MVSTWRGHRIIPTSTMDVVGKELEHYDNIVVSRAVFAKMKAELDEAKREAQINWLRCESLGAYEQGRVGESDEYDARIKKLDPSLGGNSRSEPYPEIEEGGQ